MGYAIIALQNANPLGVTKPTLRVDCTSKDWALMLLNWKEGKNPSDDPAWKSGVFAETKLIPENLQKMLDDRQRDALAMSEHTSWCEMKDGFNCDCGVDEAARNLDSVNFFIEVYMKTGTNMISDAPAFK